MNQFLYFLLFGLTVHAVIRAYVPLLGHDAVYLFFLLLFVLLFVRKSFRKISLSMPCLVFLLLIFYHIINCRLQVTSSELLQSTGFTSYSSLWKAIFPNAIILCLVPYLSYQDEKKTNMFIKWGYVVYILLGTILLKMTGDPSDRMKGGLIHPNQLAQGCGLGLMFFLYLKYRYGVSYKQLLLISIVPILGIVMSTSRNGLSLVGIYLLTVSLAPMFKGRKANFQLKKILTVVSFGVIALFLLSYLMDNTEVGERLSNTDDTADVDLQTGTILDLLGERAWYYYLGWLNFLDNPLFGIGLWHFDTYNKYGLPLHSEYMIHIAEGGIIAAILYFSFILFILFKLVRNFLYSRDAISFILLMMFLSYLFVGITAREFYYAYFYPILGVIIYNISRKSVN